MTFTIRAATLPALLLLTPQISPAQSGITRAWAVDDGEKVKRTDLNHWAATSPGNRVWDGSTIRLFGARNEIVAFQVILEAGSSGASDVDIRFDTLTGPGGYLITNSGNLNDPFDFVGKHIELFVEHYVNVTQRSMTGGVAAWSGARPLPDSEHLGWIPDALIPIRATPGTDSWIGGVPFTIPPTRNQGIWIDVTVPHEAPPGLYEGRITVTEGTAVAFSIPVSMQVYGFTLPDSTHFQNMFYINPALLTRHPGISQGTPEFWSLFRKYMHLARRHRMDLTDGRRTLSEFTASLSGYYTGTLFTAQYGYDGPGAGIGNQTYCIGTYDQPDNGRVSGFDPATQEVWQAAADAWEHWFLDNAPQVVRFKYMTDEPDRDTTAFYEEIRTRAGWIHSSPGVGRNLKIFCTVKVDPRLFGSVDFWSVTSQSGYNPGDDIHAGYIIARAADRRARGERVGFYNGTRPAYGIFEWIDNFATDPRVNSWIAWKYGVDQYFLWETGQIYNQSFQTKQNPWVTPYQTYTNNRVKWGHGTILYTGNDNLFPTESRGIDGPIASIRIKNWRRGQQDYEYLWLARQAGLPIDSIVNTIVPAAFDDYNGTTFTSQAGQPVWAQRGYLFENARAAVAGLLESTPKTTTPPAGTFTADPSSVPPGGGEATLSWTSANAAGASIEPGIGNVPLSGSRTVQVSSPTRFVLTLWNDGGTVQLNADVDVDTASHDITGTLNAVPGTLPHGGGAVTLFWSSTGATGSTLTPLLGSVPVAGSATVQVDQPTRFTLLLWNDHDSLRLSAEVAVDTARAPVTGSFSVIPSFLPAGGGDVVLTWSSFNVVSASIDNGVGAVYPSGSRTVHVGSSTRFTLSLVNIYSHMDLSADVVVDTTHLAPSGQLSLDPPELPPGGGEVTLSWSSSNATSAFLNHGLNFVELNGSRTVRVDSSTSFTLRLANPWDTAYVSAGVSVGSSFPPPSGFIYAHPEFIPAEGGEVDLTWYSSGGTSVTLNQGIGVVTPSGSRRLFLSGSATFVLTIANPSDTARISSSVTVVATSLPYGANALRNPGFQDGLEGWLFHTNAAAMVTVDSPGCASATALRVRFSGAGTIADLMQRGLAVGPGAVYRLSFDACAPRSQDLDVSFAKDASPQQGYGLLSYRCDLTPVWKNYRIYFIAPDLDATVFDGTLRFTLAPYASVDDEYRIDNVSLQRVVSAPRPLEPPVLILPLSDSTGYAPVLDLAWTTTPGATRYHLQVGRDTSFAAPAYEDSLLNGTRTTVGPLVAGARYYLRLRAANDSTSSAFSLISVVTISAAGPAALAVDYHLEQNYPNPFNAGTRIRYTVPAPAEVRLIVYDILGREIAVLATGYRGTGVYEAEFSPTYLPSGVYFYSLRAGDFTDVRKMVLVK